MNKKSIRKTNSSRKITLLQKIVTITFISIFAIILIIVLYFNWIPYCANKDFLIPNTVSLLISLIVGGIIFFLFKRKDISSKTFRILVIVIFFLLFLLQLLIMYHSYFKTGWDAKTVNDLADTVVQEGVYTTAGSSPYLTMYKNNTLIVTILALIKSLPVIGSNYFTVLAINALLVNLAGLLVCLTLKKLISNKAGILSIFITAPLLLLSPWIIIPYSDTFTIVFPILIFYIYISTNKWWKYGIIVFLSLIGYFIKPSAIIMLIAIIIVELFKKRWRLPRFNKDFWLKSLTITNGILFAFLIKYASLSFINYQQIKDTPQASFIHYLAMGQNNEKCGQYLEEDYEEMNRGIKHELKKFCNRITSRSPIEQINFFAQKLLVNFNDGTFAWAVEGDFFKEIPKREDPISVFISSFYYIEGSNIKLFTQIEQTIWLFVLFGCIFVTKKNNSLEKTVLELSLIGIFLFVMIFESRARYLFLFSPIFITCSILGYHNLTNYILRLHQKHQSKN